MKALFRIELLGACRITDTTSGAEVEFKTRKAKCVLGILALSPEGRISRERLSSLLWDPAPEGQARASLRQSLREIRESFGARADQVIDASRFHVELRRNAVDVDALACRQLLNAAASDAGAALAAAVLWKGDLFGQLPPPAPVFEAWLQVERTNLRSLLTKSLTDRLETLMAAADFGDARAAEELIRIEPSHELAHQFLMRFHAMRGDQAAALRQYVLLDKALAEELDSEPSSETNDLLVAVKRGDIGPKSVTPQHVAPPRAPRQGPPKIAVRPPLTRHADASKDYLGEGFAYLAKSCLSRFRCWIVVPWPSRGYESDTAVDFSALGEAIGADFVVDCVLDWRSSTGKLFVSLIDCRDGREVWSRVYPVAEHDLQELGSTVAGAVAAHLASQVNYISLLRHARSVPGSPVAYDLWLKGHQLSRMWNAEADVTAEDLFKRAIELDPGLACSYASLAAILNTRFMVRPGYTRREQDCAEALKHAQNAVALDPFDSRCHIGMAWSWLIARSAERAQSHFRLAVELNPHDSETLISAAAGMAFLGHIEDAKRWSALAVSFDPLFPEYFRAYLAIIYYLCGDFAATAGEVAKNPDVFFDLMAWAAAAFAQLGEEKRAAEAYRSFCSLAAPKWEGGSALSEIALESWLLDVNPILWQDGRESFEHGIRLARQFASKAYGASLISGTCA
ncbi:MAG: BTAD domain-containing putative transcriptional regulator [Aestuariivirga sp.]|uniref:BTAD domain-containing putative transcriptional regulator n=1 Tax=Aestuariivirga sp. TaxID=2650926 RepID=UPI0038D0A10D